MPSSLEAEQAVLGTILVNPSVLDKVTAWVRYPDAFWRNTHKKIFACLQEMQKRAIAIDTITLYNFLKDKHGEEQPAYLIELVNKANLENVDHHSKIIWQRFVERKALDISKQMESASKKGGDSLIDLMNQHRRWVDELENLQPSREKSIDVVLEEAIINIKAGNNIIEFGLPFMDDAAGGMTRGELTTLGGRPGHGKTTLTLNIVDALCKAGRKVLVLNREMTNTEAMKKLICLSTSDVFYEDLRKKEIKPDIMEKIEAIKDEMKTKYKNLTMHDEIIDLDEGLREIRRVKPDVFIDDYIQLIKVNGKKRDRRFEIEDVMNEYKWACKQIKCSGFLVSQLNREIEKRLDPSPTLGDYAEGGTIEQMSENCYFIYYGYTHNPMDNHPGQIEVIIKKARYGTIGRYMLHYDGGRCKIWEN